jgi:hypothetical protein
VVARHLVARHLESLQTVDHLLHALRHHHVMNALLVAEDQIGQELHVKFPRVVKSAIHAGLGQHHKNAINREFVHVSLNRIFLKM